MAFKDEEEKRLTTFKVNNQIKPVASVYFRFSHRDKDGNILTNEQ